MDRATGGLPPVGDLAQTPDEFSNVRLHGHIEPHFGSDVYSGPRRSKKLRPIRSSNPQFLKKIHLLYSDNKF